MDALSDVAPYLITVGALLIASAFFSGTEVAMFSLRRVDREQMGRSERRVDKLVYAFVSRPRRLIATLLIGNEIVNVSISSTMAAVGGIWFAGRGDLAIALLTMAVALPLVLLIGEVTPKTLAIKTSKGWARKAARPLFLFDFLVTPLRVVVRGIAMVILIPLGVDPRRPPPRRSLGEEEFKALVDAGIAEGEVGRREQRLIYRMFEFGEKTVGQVMVPADEAFLLAYNMPLSRILAEVARNGFSRVPIFHKSHDNILGILFAKDMVLLSTGLTAPRRLGELLHEPLFVPRNMRLEKLFDIFKERKTHLAIVVNEYGKFAGLVTMEDLLEQIVGPIRDEKEIHRQRTIDGVPTVDAVSPTIGEKS